MAVFSSLESSLSLDSSDFKRGLKRASGAAASFSKTTSSAFEDVDDEASGAQRAIGRVSNAMSSLGRSSAAVVVPVNRAAGEIDNAGDEASGTTRSFAALSMTTSGLSASFGILTASATSAAGAIGLIAVALSPLLPVIATAAGAFGAIAAIFGVIVGSGVAAWMKKTGKSLKQIKQIVMNAVTAFGKRFVPLIEDAVALLPSFISRISDAVGSLEPFVDALRVLGSVAYKVIPPLIGVFADLARSVLPFVTGAAKWIGQRLVPALEALFAAGKRAAGPVFRLAQGLFNVAKSLAGVAGWVGRFATALYDLAAAALGVGKLTKELRRVGEVIKGGLMGAFQWLSTTGVQLATQAFGLVADAASSAFSFVTGRLAPAIINGIASTFNWVSTKGVQLAITTAKNLISGFVGTLRQLSSYNLHQLMYWMVGMVAKLFGAVTGKSKKEIQKLVTSWQAGFADIYWAVKQGLVKAWQWVRTKGVALARNALRTLSNAAMSAFKFTKQEVIPAISTGLGKAWQWVRTKGVTKAKSALGFLSDKALAAFEFTKTEIIPAIRSGLGKAWNWIRTKGKTKAKSAFKFLSNKALAAFEFTKQEIIPAIRSGLGKAWNWIRTKGKTKAKSAFKFLSNKALAAFEFTKTEIVPRVKRGLQKAWKWLRTKGATRTKNALKFLADKAAKGFKWTKKELVPKVRSAISGLSKWLRTKGKTKLKKALDTMARLATKGWNFGQKHLLKPIQKGIRKTVQWIKTKGWTAFKAAFRGWGQSIGKFALAWIRTIRDTFAKGIPKLRNWLSNNGVRLIKQAFFNIGRGIRNAILAIFTAGGIVFQALVSSWTGLVNWLKSGGAKKIKSAFVDIFTGIGHYLMNQAMTDIVNAVKFIIDAIFAVFEGLYQGLIGGSLIPRMMEDIATYIRTFDLAGAFSSMLHSAWVQISQFAHNALRTIKGGFGQIVSYFKNDFISDIVGALRNAAKRAVEAFKAKFNAMMPDKIGIPSVTIAGHHVGGGSIDLPSLAAGGTIQSDGLFYGHAGETIVPADADTPYSGSGSGGGTQDVTVTLDVRGDSELARMVERHIEANEQGRDTAIARSQTSFGSGSGGRV